MTDALLLDRDLVLRSGPLRVPEPRPGQLLVRVGWAGVCGRDLHVLRTGDQVASWPARLGHEITGTVAHCPGDEVPVGSLVVVDPWGSAHADGFAGHLLADARQVVVCPDDLEPAIAVLAEPLAVAMHILGRMPRSPERTTILGYGPIGALAHLEIGRRWPGAEVAVVEPVAARRELASALGAAVVSRDEVPGWNPQLVVDAALIAQREVVATGSQGFHAQLADAVAVLAANPGRYRPVVTDAVLLDEAPARLRSLLGSPAPGKVLIHP